MSDEGYPPGEQRVCAVIVTYHPTVAMTDNLPSIRSQVQGLVVVDNGSNADAIERLRSVSLVQDFALLENVENRGIAAALNQGVEWAKERDFEWIILFDQDSKLTDDFVHTMLADWKAHPRRDLIGSMHPRYVDPTTKIEPMVLRARDGGPVTSMTSGALMPAWIFDHIGYFPPEFFIDQVDTEYCFRIRAAGYMVADSRNTILWHAPGAPKRLRFWFISFEPTHHSASRRYYLSRNRVVVFKKYFRILPGMVSRAMYYAFRETVKCILAERGRLRKLRSIVLGTWDGFTGRMGKRENI